MLSAMWTSLIQEQERPGMGWVERGLQGHFKALVGPEFFYYGGFTLHHIKHIKTNPHPTLNIIFSCKFFFKKRMLIILPLKLFGYK